MRQVFFYTVLLIFVSTAVVTLLGLVGAVEINEKYFTALVGTFLLETGGAILMLFKKTDFFEVREQSEATDFKNTARVDVVMLPRELFPVVSDPHKCKIAILNSDNIEERTVDVKLVRTNGYLSALVDDLVNGELLQVTLINKDGSVWESEYFDPGLAKAELREVQCQ